MRLSNSGFTLTELIIACGAGVLVASLGSVAYLQLHGLGQKQAIRATLTELKGQFESVINDDFAWQATIANTAINGLTTFDCLRNAAIPCVPAAAVAGPLPPGYRFSPLDRNGALDAGFNPRNNVTHGFSVDGLLCNSWSAAVLDPACPIRVDFTWQPICAAGPSCVNPPVEITITFRVTAAAGSPFGSLNMANYTSRIVRQGNRQRVLQTACGATEVITGFDLSGQPICVQGSTVAP